MFLFLLENPSIVVKLIVTADRLSKKGSLIKMNFFQSLIKMNFFQSLIKNKKHPVGRKILAQSFSWLILPFLIK